VIVDGRVQGVFFRATCAARARERGLSGWIRNLPDGGVEAVFEGGEDDVEALVGWCGVGPDGARVDRLERTVEAPTGEPGFRIQG